MTARAAEELEGLKKLIIKDAWPYWVGGVLLGLLNIDSAAESPIDKFFTPN